MDPAPGMPRTPKRTANEAKVADQVYLVPRTRGANVFLLANAQSLTLIDTGLPGNEQAILRFVSRLGYAARDLRRILLTHAHPDHTGSAKAIRAATGAQVLLHEADSCMSSALMRTVRCPGIPSAVTPPQWRVPVDGLVEEGDVVDGLRIFHTPGHTPGGISLFDEDRAVLFSGDLLTQRGRYVSRSVPFPGTRLSEYHASLERMAGLPATVACLGHGSPLTQMVPDILRGAAEWYRTSPAWRRWLQRVPGPFRLGLNVGYRYR